VVGGEEDEGAGMGQHQPALSIKIHNPTFLLGQVIFMIAETPSPRT